MNVFYKALLNGGADQSPSSLNVGRFANNRMIDVNNIAKSTTLTVQSPSNEVGNFFSKYWFVLLLILLLIVIAFIVYKFMINPTNPTNSTVPTNSTTNPITINSTTPNNDNVKVSNIAANTVAVSSNNKGILFQESTVNGETITNFKKFDNGVSSNTPSQADLDKIEAIRIQNLDFAAQQTKAALDQADKIKQMNANLFTK